MNRKLKRAGWDDHGRQQTRCRRAPASAPRPKPMLRLARLLMALTEFVDSCRPQRRQKADSLPQVNLTWRAAVTRGVIASLLSGLVGSQVVSIMLTRFLPARFAA